MTKEILQDTDLVQEYVEYLRLKVKKDDDGAYHCETSVDDYKCWDKTEQFCKEKRLNFNLEFGCESNIATSFDLDAFCKRIKELKEEG